MFLFNEMIMITICSCFRHLLRCVYRFIMAELLQTERTYVKDLETCIRCFLEETRCGGKGNVPSGLQGRESIIFSNMEEIHQFHNNIFLRELEKYETMPEDVGHCFVTWVSCISVYFVSFLCLFVLNFI